MLDTLKTLCYLSGVSGAEDEVRDYIFERAIPCADELFTDAMGNIVVFKKGRTSLPRKIMLCAHMDEVGMIVTSFTDDGYLRFDFVGGVDRRVVIGKRVFVGSDRVPGVVGIRAIHLVDKDERNTVPKTEALYIDIGAKNKDDAKKMVSLGDPVVFDDGIFEFGDDLFKAKAIDDRVGCAVLLKLLETDIPYDCYFAFTAQEEVGTRGAYTAAFAVAPDIALIVEGTTAADIPGVDDAKKICRLGDGVVIPFMDKGTMYDRGLYKHLTELAEQNGVAWQTKNVISGGTDAQAVQRSRSGVKTAGVAVGIRNIHTPACVGKISDFEALYKLCGLFLESLEHIE